MQNVSGYIMTPLKFIILFFSIALYSCGQNEYYSKVDVKVARLSNKIIPLVNFLDNPDSCKQALLFLDSATTIDSGCFLCYYNKLMFSYSLKKYDKAIEAINGCIRINPLGHDLYLTGGVLYEKIGDTIHSNSYFKKSLEICNSVLDTIKINDINYDMLVSNKAINLIMIGKKKDANEILQKLHDKQTDSDLQKITLSMMNKSKKELVDSMTNSQYSR